MHRVVLVAFAGAQTLDVAGPGEVFGSAGRQLGRGAYDVILASTSGGSIGTTCGFEIAAKRLASIRVRRTDTVLVSGGDEGAIRAAVADGL